MTSMKVEDNCRVIPENKEDIKVSIKSFYKNAVIFITGGTGFLGKVLIEKLLRSCPDIVVIYVHVRTKRGVTSENRYKELLNHDIFERLRSTNPSVFSKLVCIAGDMAEPNLGLSNDDFQTILQTTTIVFHNAATVKFNEPLKEAGNLNAYGTYRLMEMCTQMPNLKSLVHVSTAYCNPGRKHVGEKVYPSSAPLDKGAFMKFVRILPNNILNSLFDAVKGPHPNSYTLTKSIAELIVSEYSMKFPVAIVRPSIITGSMAEPYPGWVDNIQGITGIMMEIGRGTIKSIFGDGKLACDIIPVDVVVNAMIGAARKSFISNNQMTHVYNCTSSQIKPLLWSELGVYTQKWARVYPSKYLMLYPHFNYTTNKKIHQFYETFYHMFPAYIYDILAKLKGAKPMMLKMAKKLQANCEIGKFFVLNEWAFENDNQKQLAKDMMAAEDGDEFCCDISELDYDEYLKNFMLGIRKYVLKDDEKSLSAARQRLIKLYWLRTIYHLALFVLLIYVFLKIFKPFA